MKNQSGKAGEEHIARWLESQGYEILARNFHSRYGEIDIVAQRPPYIAFVEVKPRVAVSYTHLDVYKRQGCMSQPSMTSPTTRTAR